VRACVLVSTAVPTQRKTVAFSGRGAGRPVLVNYRRVVQVRKQQPELHVDVDMWDGYVECACVCVENYYIVGIFCEPRDHSRWFMTGHGRGSSKLANSKSNLPALCRSL
jgi:hypothetical protein